MKRCPKCGCETFYVTAHVVQDWKVDKDGEYIETVEDCVEVAHFPDDMDIWSCANCDYEDIGSAFNIEETVQND